LPHGRKILRWVVDFLAALDVEPQIGIGNAEIREPAEPAL
jgi:hypothetical protein